MEEIVNIYCKQHNIEDNEISEKIRTIYYHNPEQNILIDYNKDRGDEFPLSRHLQIRPRKEEINYEEEENDDEDEKEKEKINIKEIIKDKNEEQKIDNSNEEKLLECFICGWIFLKEMSIEEKNRHINFCIEGKGEENKKELISTYKELENLRNNENRENNNDNEEVNNEENDE